MSGEYRVSQPLVFRREAWGHTMSPSKFVADPNLRRAIYVNEKLKGVIHYADVDNKELEKENLLLFRGYPCWPNPDILLDMLDRHAVLARCFDKGFLNHTIIQGTNEIIDFDLSYPIVLKLGHSHRGIGKYLLKSSDDFVGIDLVGQKYSIEPFFVGKSVRILILGDEEFGILVTNDQSWISNSAGAEVSLFEPSAELVKHARSVAEEFKLEAAGVDYILEDNGKFHFLEINQYPGLDVDDKVVEVANKFLNEKMDFVEKMS